MDWEHSRSTVLRSPTSGDLDTFRVLFGSPVSYVHLIHLKLYSQLIHTIICQVSAFLCHWGLITHPWTVTFVLGNNSLPDSPYHLPLAQDGLYSLGIHY